MLSADAGAAPRSSVCVELEGHFIPSLTISGYDDDSRELFEIPEVCRYLRGLDHEWPFWFFFLIPPLN